MEIHVLSKGRKYLSLYTDSFKFLKFKYGTTPNARCKVDFYQQQLLYESLLEKVSFQFKVIFKFLPIQR